ncbi:hypothetical protein EMIT0P100_20761 [Pseudomonas sp. IT-P100]
MRIQNGSTLAAMAQASTSGSEKAASLVCSGPRAKHWRLPVERDLSVIAPPSSFASRKEPDLRAINAQLRCIQMKYQAHEKPHRPA